jgi:hypothetical protein
MFRELDSPLVFRWTQSLPPPTPIRFIEENEKCHYWFVLCWVYNPYYCWCAETKANSVYGVLMTETGFSLRSTMFQMEDRNGDMHDRYKPIDLLYPILSLLREQKFCRREHCLGIRVLTGPEWGARDQRNGGRSAETALLASGQCGPAMHVATSRDVSLLCRATELLSRRLIAWSPCFDLRRLVWCSILPPLQSCSKVRRIRPAPQQALGTRSFATWPLRSSRRRSLNEGTNSGARVRERTIPTERPPLVGEDSANFCA